MRCEDVRELAPETALDVLDAAVRADVLAHVATCASCRDELAALSAAADALLLAVPPVEPPAGFELRVVARMGRRRRRWAAPALAAAAALVVGLVGGWTLRPHRTGSLEAAWLVGSTGQAVGQVLVSDDRMVCVLDYAPAGASYDVQITTGGHDRDLGTFTTAGPGQAWTAGLPVHGREVSRIVIRDDHGVVRATATV